MRDTHSTPSNPASFIHHPVFWLAIVLIGLSVLAWAGTLPIGRVTQVAVYTLYAAGVSLLVAYIGLVPFGASVFFGCSSYAAALFSLRWFDSEIAGIAFSIAFSMGLAIMLGALILRRKGLYFSLLTLAASQIAFEVAFKWTSFTGGENGIQDVPRPLLDDPRLFHGFALISTIGCLWLVWRLVHAPFGRVLQAVRDNEQRAASVGYDTYRYKLGAFVAAGAIIGWAGALQTYLLRGAYANSLSWQHAGDALLMAVLGGTNHFLGALWGAIAFILLEDRLSAITENWWLIFAPIIIGFVLLAPDGLHGLVLRGLRMRTKGKVRWTLVRDTIAPRPTHIAPLVDKPTEMVQDTPLLQVRDISKRFGALVVADALDLDVRARQLHSIIGPNGAGKTTLFHMLSGVLRPDAGQVLFMGQDITGLPLHQRVKLGLSRSFQIVSVFQHLTAFENVRVAVQAQLDRGRGLWRDAHRIDAINARTWTLLDAVGLADHAASGCDILSHGQKRLLEIAITMATDARLLLFDEPLAGLAEVDRHLVSTLIRRLAKTHGVLLIEHDIDRVLAISDRITVLHQGRCIADGKPADIAVCPAVVAAYLGTDQHKPVRPAVLPSAVKVKTSTPLLLLQGVCAGYGGGRILDGIDFQVGDGEIVALLGRNGVGKTTLLNVIAGTVPITAGSIRLCGQDIQGMATYRINRSGISVVPEGRRLFGNLSVLDNLRLAQRRGGTALDDVFALFPKLQSIQSRKAEHLSGGEQQMVAIARALMAPGRLILMDEPFEGLAPTVVQEVMQAIVKLRGRTSLVLVEHHAQQVLPIADRAYVLVNGKVAYAGSAHVLGSNPERQAALLGIVQPMPTLAAEVRTP